MIPDQLQAKNIWLISPFSDPSTASDRYRYICQELAARKAHVCQYVSGFNHLEKRLRRASPAPWRCIEVFETGYRRNVGIQRVLSHLVFDCLILFYLIREAFRSGLPDTILSALPHNGAACVAALFAKTTRAKFIVDIHDTWPESILSVAKPRGISHAIFILWKFCADLALYAADDVFGESLQYAHRANSIRDRFGLSRAKAIYIGGDMNYYLEIPPAGDMPLELNNAKFIMAYAGNLGNNYDLDCLIDAFSDFEKEYPDAGLMILGCGEMESDIRAKLFKKCKKAWISGRISHRSLLGYLKKSHVGINCFKSGGNVAYSYKLNDYLLVGLPVINSLAGEAADIISNYNIGANYQAGDKYSMLRAFRACYAKWNEDPCWARRSAEFCSEALDRTKSYQPLIRSCLHEA